MLSLSQIRSRISTFFEGMPVENAYMFGFYARGEATQESDIDILVDLDPHELVGLANYTRMLDELSFLLNHKIDLVASDSISRHIKPGIDRKKKLIYEARSR